MRPVTGLVLGSILIPLGLVLSLIWLPSSIADALSYGFARSCTEPVPNGAGCWSEVSAIVTKTEVLSGRYTTRSYVDLRDDFGSQEVEVLPGTTFDNLRSGDPVSARFWRGEVALIHVPRATDLTTASHPTQNMGIALVAVAAALLFGGLFFLGALGVHRYQGSWTVSLSGSKYDEHMFDAVAPPTRRWLEGSGIIAFGALAGGVLANANLGTAIVPGVLVSAGLAALAWAWWLHHRARRSWKGGKSRSKPR
jgi:hypothetical protein